MNIFNISLKYSRKYLWLFCHWVLGDTISVDSCGGNLLINVGPTGDGRIPAIFEERLLQFGSWMSVNQEAVYATRPWRYQNDTVTPYVWYAEFATFMIYMAFLQN